MFSKTNKLIQDTFEMEKTSILKSDDTSLKKAFKQFLEKPLNYKKEFLQTQFNSAFDGYSYLGQEDSKNQYKTDLLHSFVLSQFTKKEYFPLEFHSFLSKDWCTTLSKIKEIELQVIKKLEIPYLEDFYKENIGHMVSCNYYPKINSKTQKSKLRLSKHKDVSLFTVFIYGATNGFSYKNNFNEKINIGTTQTVFIFPGYLLEFLTNGKYKALEHQVDFTTKNEERFSFAFFSIPKPSKNLTFNNIKFTSTSYYKKYLSLF